MSKRVLVTGAAGFIGYHTSKALLERGDEVIGLDNYNDYYDPYLKLARAKRLYTHGMKIVKGDITDRELLKTLFDKFEFTHVLHLAAQAGVRYARKHPDVYMKSNLDGFLSILEQVKENPSTPLIYASSSSVYGANDSIPFSTSDRTDQPANLYAATKKANEAMAYAYHHMYGIPTTGLRYFTVYGPWGRPDMAYYSFTDAITNGKPIRLFNQGEMWRDFTFIDDIVDGTIAALDLGANNAVFNLGNHRSESLKTFVSILEEAIGRKAIIELAECPTDEMIKTYANIDSSIDQLNFKPKVTLKEGLHQFVEWYQQWSTSQQSESSLKTAGS